MPSKITIPNPCPKKWTELSGESSTRFCGTCSKQVHDFTKMETQEIIKFLKKGRGSVCGVFSKTQIHQMSFKEKVKFSVKEHKRNPLKLSTVLATILFFTLLNFFSSCVQKTMGEIVPVSTETVTSLTTQTPPTDDTITTGDSSETNNLYMMGEIEFVPEDTLSFESSEQQQIMGKLHVPSSFFNED